MARVCFSSTGGTSALHIAAKTFSSSGILKREQGFQRGARQDAMLGIGLLMEQELTPVAPLLPGTKLTGFHIRSSASVEMTLVEPRAPLPFPESGDML